MTSKATTTRCPPEGVLRRRGDLPSLRALTDLELWRGPRHHGATPEAAAERRLAAR